MTTNDFIKGLRCPTIDYLKERDMFSSPFDHHGFLSALKESLQRELALPYTFTCVEDLRKALQQAPSIVLYNYSSNLKNFETWYWVYGKATTSNRT